MHSLSLLALVMAGSSSAIPTNGPPKTSTCKNPTYQAANFDDLTAVPLVEFNEIPLGYKGLYFQGFANVGVVETGVLPGTQPHSLPNFAASNTVSTTLQGSAEWTTNYSGSKVKSFTPSSFYYSCVLNLGQGTTAPPSICNIAITGFRSGDVTGEAVQVAAQEFSYNPTTFTGLQQQTLGTFNSDFHDLEYVLIQYTPPGGGSALSVDLALLIDDLKFKTCDL